MEMVWTRQKNDSNIQNRIWPCLSKHIANSKSISIIIGSYAFKSKRMFAPLLFSLDKYSATMFGNVYYLDVLLVESYFNGVSKKFYVE